MHTISRTSSSQPGVGRSAGHHHGEIFAKKERDAAQPKDAVFSRGFPEGREGCQFPLPGVLEW